jgi:hypothetical protein
MHYALSFPYCSWTKDKNRDTVNRKHILLNTALSR